MSKVVKSEMAGTVLEVKVKAGDTIKAGQEVAVVESMKMEVPLQATEGGVVAVVKKAVGDFLNEGETFLELK